MSMSDTTAKVRRTLSDRSGDIAEAAEPVRSTADDVRAAADDVRAAVRDARAAVWAAILAVLAPVLRPAGAAYGSAARTAAPYTAPVRTRYAAFTEWRSERPFAGGVLLFLAGLVVGWVPIQFAAELMLVGGEFTVVGLLFASMLVVTAGFVLAYPQYSRQLGVVGVVLSLLSIFGALGGLGVGLMLGLVGGNLCVAWERPDHRSVAADDPDPPAEDERRIADATATLRTAISND